MSLTLILTMVNGMTLAQIDDRVTMICVGQNLTLKVEVEIIEILGFAYDISTVVSLLSL